MYTTQTDKLNFDLFLEKSILSSLFQNNKLIIDAMTRIKPNYFYATTHKVFFSSMIDLYDKTSSFDISSVNGITDSKYLNELSEIVDCHSSTCIDTHLDILTDLYKRRYIEKTCLSILDKLSKDSIQTTEIINDMSECSLRLAIEKNELPVSVHHLIGQMFEDMEKKSKTKGIGIKTGFYELDKRISGLQEQNLIIIAGRPGVGKSLLALNFLSNSCIDSNANGLYINLEMSNLQTLYRVFSDKSDVDKDSLLSGKVLIRKDIEKVHAFAEKIYAIKDKMFFYDRGTLTIEDIKAITKMYCEKYAIKILVVDYLQLITNTGLKKGNQREEIEHKVRQLKLLAKDLNITVIALSQLSRSCETRIGEDRRPKLSDLRDTGAIEQDADIVMFPYRPYMHGNDLYNTGKKALENEAEILTSKHREGVPGIDYIGFDGSKSRFYNIEIKHSEENEGNGF